jgi:hypothetical protein
MADRFGHEIGERPDLIPLIREFRDPLPLRGS